MYIGEKLREYLDFKGFLSGIEIPKVNSIKPNSKDIKKGDAFLAIRGGNNYIKDAINRGAKLIIYDKKVDLINLNSNIKLLKVKNSIKFLQDFASYYRKKLDPIVIGITGSNGKTTTKDILYSILKEKYKTQKTRGNYNNHIGLPLTILNLKKDTECLILEMGMSNLGEIDFLSKIARPNYGIITNIGEAHLEQLKTRENIFKAKTEMLKYIDKKVIVNGDDEFLKNVSGIKVGFKTTNNIYAQNIRLNNAEQTMVYDLKLGEKSYPNINIDILGKHNILNSLLAIAMANELNLDIQKIKKGLNNIQISDMRNQIIKKEKTIYINDAYNASPTSVKSGLEFFSSIYKNKKKIIVLGDMLELGPQSPRMHVNIKKEIEKYQFEYIFLYGKNMRCLYNEFKKENKERNMNIGWFKSKEKIKESILKINEEKVVYLKGSRGMALEKIIEE